MARSDTSRGGRSALTVLFALAIGVAGACPLLLRGASCGQDFDFHLQSWLAVRSAWSHGLIVPHWVPAANYGAGEPRFLFYPPLSWLLGALLRFVLPWAWVPWAFTVLTLAAMAWSMRWAAARIAEPAAAWAAAILYALSPYLLFCAYERGALAELLAGVFFPPLFALLTRERLPVLKIALLLAGLWYTNAPAAVMGCYLVLLAAVWRSLPAWRAARLPGLGAVWARTATALALGCALAADYLLPAWHDERFVSIARAIGPGMRVEDSFLFGHTGEPYHDQVLRTASWIAVMTFGAGLVLAAAAWKRRGTTGGHATAALCTLTLAVCLLFQFRLSLPVWNHLPQLAFLQFPWRLLLPATAAGCLLFAIAAQSLRRELARRTAMVLAMCVGTGLIAWAGVTRFQPCDDEDNVAAQLLLPGSGGFEGTDEYTAADSDNNLIQQGAPRVRLLRSPNADEGTDDAPNPDWSPVPAATVPGRIVLRSWQPEHLSVRVRPEDPAYAVLLLARFPDWRVLVDGAPCRARCIEREDGLLTIAVPPGRWTTIDLAFHTSAVVWLGRAISLAALLLLVAAALRARRAMHSAIMSRNVD